MKEKKCSVDHCGLPPVHLLYKGRLYCKKHYDSLLHSDFLADCEAWPMGEQPNERLRSLFGRMLEEVWGNRSESYLTKARIRDRGFNFSKAPNGFTFEITRHPNAIKDGFVSERIVEKWHVNITDGYFKKIMERGWTKSDPE